MHLSLQLSSAVFVWCYDLVLENLLAAWLLISKCCSWYPQESNTDGTRPGASDINPHVSDLKLHYSFFYYCAISLPELGMEGEGRRSWQRYRLEWQRVKVSATENGDSMIESAEKLKLDRDSETPKSGRRESQTLKQFSTFFFSPLCFITIWGRLMQSLAVL